MPERVERGGDELEHAERASTANGVGARTPGHREDEQEGQEEAGQRREHDRGPVLATTVQTIAPRGLRQPGPEQPADQGVRAARRDAQPPGDHVPGDGAHERAEDHVRVDDVRGDDAGADRLRHVQAEEQEGDEVEKRRERHRLQRPQHARRDHGCDRVCCVVEAVEEIEQEGDGDQADQGGQAKGHVQRRRVLAGQACSMTRLWTSLATSSKRSTTFSR